jgi:DNA-binding transcriptional LysR family regulator
MQNEALMTFLTVHRAGSVSAASESLHLSQPAVTRRLQVLERQVGVLLFDRTSVGLRLSPAGRVLLPHAERAVAAERDGLRAVMDHVDGRSGVVTLGLVGSLAGTWLTSALQAFADQHPGVEVALSTATSFQISEQVRRGDLMLGISYARPPGGELEVDVLFGEELVVVCHPGHPRASGRVASLAELRDERWLVFPDVAGQPESAASVARQLLDEHQVPVELLRPIDSLTAQRSLAQAGFGLVFAPVSAVAEDLAGGRLATIDVADARPATPVTLLTRRDAYLGRAATNLVDRLRAAAAS